MSQVISKDGTPIAYDVVGDGPAVILVGGGLTDRAENAPLAPELASGFTVYNYDRRGRGLSGDTPPYALEREIEDLGAMIAVAGGSAHLFGASSGGALALEAAAAGLPIGGIAAYEVPYDLRDDGPQRQRDYRAGLAAALAEGRRGDAMELFMRLAGASGEDVAGARSSPMWPDLEAMAHTLAYDAACVGDGTRPPDRLAGIGRPVLALTGGTPDPHTAGLGAGFFDRAADAIAATVPNAERRVIGGQSHVADPAMLAPVLAEFFRNC